MHVTHRFVGYDRSSDRPTARFNVAIELLPRAKRIANVAGDDPEALWSYSLSAAQARALAKLLGVEIEPSAADFYLEAFAAPADLGSAPG